MNFMNPHSPDQDQNGIYLSHHEIPYKLTRVAPHLDELITATAAEAWKSLPRDDSFRNKVAIAAGKNAESRVNEILDAIANKDDSLHLYKDVYLYNWYDENQRYPGTVQIDFLLVAGSVIYIIEVKSMLSYAAIHGDATGQWTADDTSVVNPIHQNSIHAGVLHNILLSEGKNGYTIVPVTIVATQGNKTPDIICTARTHLYTLDDASIMIPALIECNSRSNHDYTKSCELTDIIERYSIRKSVNPDIEDYHVRVTTAKLSRH